ncbi:MAG: hypothetical protein P4N60_05925 [Verrucomicrobiae bacterium]|nr:hypothetical protein [Verrucomicrobiae bacterium]
MPRLTRTNRFKSSDGLELSGPEHMPTTLRVIWTGVRMSPPRKPPPAEDQGESRATELPFGGAGTATDLRRGRPPGEDERGPDLVNLVDVNRPQAVAFGAIATPGFLNFAFQHVGRDIFRDAQDIGVLMTPVVAEALAAGVDAAHDDG